MRIKPGHTSSSSAHPGRPAPARVPAFIYLLLICLMAPTQADEGDGREFLIGGSGWIGDAPTRIADALGYFNGNDTSAETIRVSQYNSGKQALDALIHNQVDFALAAPEPVAIALASAVPAGSPPHHDLVILASLALSNLSHHVVANGHQGIEGPADLTGKRIGLVLDSSAHHAWYKFTRFHGLDTNTMALVDLPIDRLTEALQTGVIDAVVIWDPWTQEIERSLGEQARVFSTRELHTVDWFLVTRRPILDSHPQVVERVLRGYVQAIDLIYRDPAQAMAAHERAAGRNDLRLGSNSSALVWRLNLGWSVLASLETQFQWLRERSDLDTRNIPPTHQYLDGRPLNRIDPRRVTLPPYLYLPPGQGPGPP